MPRKAFDYALEFKTLDFRARRELYCVGKGEQGVLLIEPYKSEILPHWAFQNSSRSGKVCAEALSPVFALLESG